MKHKQMQGIFLGIGFLVFLGTVPARAAGQMGPQVSDEQLEAKETTEEEQTEKNENLAESSPDDEFQKDASGPDSSELLSSEGMPAGEEKPEDKAWTQPQKADTAGSDNDRQETVSQNNREAWQQALTDSNSLAAEEQQETEGWFKADIIWKVGLGAGAAVVAFVLLFIGIELFKGRRGDQEEDISDTDVTHLQTEGSMTESERSLSVLPEPVLVNMPDSLKGTLGQIHHVGRRSSQQDSFGTSFTRLGLLAVVSDGMGGLSDGEKVSRKAVTAMLGTARTAALGQAGENPLYEMAGEANEQISQMLGPDRIYKSGATLLAVMVNNGKFHWVAVGDSRIYLYSGRRLFQLNREHIYKRQLILEAVNRNIRFANVNLDPQRDRLVSFLGMGDLKEIDGSLRPIELNQGDKLLLMSDGIFNTISEREILKALEETENAAQAAREMENQILAANHPNQDNFTCLILDF